MFSWFKKRRDKIERQEAEERRKQSIRRVLRVGAESLGVSEETFEKLLAKMGFEIETIENQSTECYGYNFLCMREGVQVTCQIFTEEGRNYFAHADAKDYANIRNYTLALYKDTFLFVGRENPVIFRPS